MTTKEKEISKEIFSLINNIKEHADILNSETRIQELELNMILTKIRNLHEKMVVLNFLHSYIDNTITTPAKTKIAPHQKNELDEPIIVDVKKEIIPEEKITPVMKDTSIAKKLEKQPITDLTKAIGVNDKFLFINELFDRNEKDYNECISYLNQLNNFLDADTYIRNTLRKKHNWELKKASVNRFIELVERRYL